MEFFIKLIVVSVAILGGGIKIYHLILEKKAHLKEEYKFAKEFLKDENQNDIHPFVLEKGYQVISGSNTVNSKEVSYILSLKNPSQSLRNYVFSKSLIEELKEEGSLTFKGRYQKEGWRKWFKRLYAVSYLLCALIATSPIFILDESLKKFLLLLAVMLPTFGLFAWWSIVAYVKIDRAEKLIFNQEKHTAN